MTMTDGPVFRRGFSLKDRIRRTTGAAELRHQIYNIRRFGRTKREED
jgi:hypothetical protein